MSLAKQGIRKKHEYDIKLYLNQGVQVVWMQELAREGMFFFQNLYLNREVLQPHLIHCFSSLLQIPPAG